MEITEELDEEALMQKLLGFGGFDSSKVRLRSFYLTVPFPLSRSLLPHTSFPD
jgi:hypothetical protein